LPTSPCSSSRFATKQNFGSYAPKNFVPHTRTMCTKTRGKFNGRYAIGIAKEKIKMNRWIVGDLEVMHVPKLGWCVIQNGEVQSVHANVAGALRELKEEEER